MSRRITREAAASDTIKRCIFRGQFVFSSEESEKKYCSLSNQAYPDKHEAPSPFSFTRCCSTKAAAKFNPRRISLFSTLFFSLPYIFFFYALGLFPRLFLKFLSGKGMKQTEKPISLLFFPSCSCRQPFPFPILVFSLSRKHPIFRPYYPSPSVSVPANKQSGRPYPFHEGRHHPAAVDGRFDETSCKYTVPVRNVN